MPSFELSVYVGEAVMQNRRPSIEMRSHPHPTTYTPICLDLHRGHRELTKVQRMVHMRLLPLSAQCRAATFPAQASTPPQPRLGDYSGTGPAAVAM